MLKLYTIVQQTTEATYGNFSVKGNEKFHKKRVLTCLTNGKTLTKVEGVEKMMRAAAMQETFTGRTR